MTTSSLSEKLEALGLQADLADQLDVRSGQQKALEILNALEGQAQWQDLEPVQKQALALGSLLLPVTEQAMENERIKNGYPVYVDKAQNSLRKLLWKKGFNNEKRDLRELALRLASLKEADLWARDEAGKEALALMLSDQKLLKSWSPQILQFFLETLHPERKQEVAELFENLPEIHLPEVDESRPEVIMLSGLPASGKDTLIARRYPDLDVVSLDQIRLDTGISPVGDQSEVVRIGKEKARELLEQEKPFVWNATSLTKRLRKQQADLFHSLGARVKIVYLETDFDRLLERNEKREATVPQEAIERMMNIIDPPHVWEGDEVEWILT